MSLPDTEYVKTPGGYVAYQVFGNGPIDILFISSWTSNLDVMWEFPSVKRYLNQLASFARVICFDKRGTGVSDPIPLASIPTLEEWMDDAREVLDAVGAEKVKIIGDGEGGFMANLFAATYSNRVTGLVLINSVPRWMRDEDYPIGYPTSAAQKILKQCEQYWGTGMILLLTAPGSAKDPEFFRMFARYERLCIPPGAALDYYQWVMSLDVRSVLPSITCPVLILYRESNNHYRLTYGKYLNEHIENSELVVLPGADCHPFFAGDIDSILVELEKFLSVDQVIRQPSRELVTIMFTDIVDSTRQAAILGDHEWIEKLDVHHTTIRKALTQFRGKEIETSGDGFLATFDGPARAIQCAKSIQSAMGKIGFRLRVGLHTGEIEYKNQHPHGIALHIAARIMSSADGDEIYTSRTVKDLVIGSEVEFADKGQFDLKGIPDKWQLFSVKVD